MPSYRKENNQVIIFSIIELIQKTYRNETILIILVFYTILLASIWALFNLNVF